MARYNKKIVKDICDLHEKDSYTVAEICTLVHISESTYYDWKAKKPEFSEAIKKAQDNFNLLLAAEAKKSLLKKIRGYTVIEKRTVRVGTGEVTDKGKAKTKIKEHAETEKHIQPDTAAIIFTLTNRDSDNWKNKQDTNISGALDLKSELENLSDEELETIIKNGKIDKKEGTDKT